MLILTILVCIIVFSFLVITHEFGHFWASKKVGVPVLKFAVGFWKPLFKWKRKETRYSVNVIPFGGYVEVFGSENPKEKDKKAFWQQAVGKRFLITISGVLFNLIAAWLLLTISLWIAGIIPPKNFILIQEVAKESPAETAGIKQGDFLISINGENLIEAVKISEFTRSHQGQTISLEIQRSGKLIKKEVKLSENTEAPLGISMVETGQEEKVAFWKAPYVSLQIIGSWFVATFSYIGKAIVSIFTPEKIPMEISGPVGIWGAVAQFTALGFLYLLRLAAMLSFAIGTFNLLPLPALDGGRLIFLLLEKIFGKKVVKPETENAIHGVGFIILILLMLLITYRDIMQLIAR